MWAYIASPDYKYFILLNDQSTILLHPFVSPFHSTGQHLWLSYPVPFHCITYPFPLSHFIPSRNALLNDRFILLISITHHVLFHIAPDHDRLDLLIRPGCEQPLPFFLESRNIRFDSILPRRSKIVSVLTTPPPSPPPPPPPPFSHYKPSGV